MSAKTLEHALSAAVPLWILEYKDKDLLWLQNRKEGFASIIGAKGDVLLYGGGKRGEVAQVFNVVAEGLAILALICPGGVDFGGLHFESLHKDLKGNSGS